MKPIYVLHLYADAFNEHCACLGSQVASVAGKLGESVSNLQWYVSDVEYIGEQSIKRSPNPIAMGDTTTFVHFAENVEQFTSGVFVAVPSHVTEPRFRQGGLWTEDEDESDIGDAVVEIRAFDYTYIIVAFADEHLFALIESEFS